MMQPINLYELRESFNDKGILICFAGPFSHSIIEELGNAVKRYLEAEQITKASLMDVFAIFIEQTQNVRNYAERKAAEGNRDCDFNSGVIVIGKSGDRFVVTSGNIVAREDIGPAAAQLDALQTLDKAGLKAAFKEQMRKEILPGQSAGLGLIDMARKSSEPLQYSLREIDDRYSFFSLRATV